MGNIEKKKGKTKLEADAYVLFLILILLILSEDILLSLKNLLGINYREE